MSNNVNNKTLRDELIVPFKEVLIQVAKGVAEAQRMLDQQSLELQKQIYSDPKLEELRDTGIEPTWYQIPEAKVSLKVSISMNSETQSTQTGPQIKPPKLFLAPYNATYKNSYDYGYEGTSQIEFKIVPIPPPTQASITTVPNLIGKTKQEAENLIKNAMLKIGNISEKESSEASNTIIEQDPAPDMSVNIGESLNIVIAK